MNLFKLTTSRPVWFDKGRFFDVAASLSVQLNCNVYEALDSLSNQDAAPRFGVSGYSFSTAFKKT